MKPLLIVIVIALGSTAALMTLQQRTPSAPARATAPTRQVAWSGHVIEVPRGWASAGTGPGYAVWSDAGRRHTLTVGLTPGSTTPPLEVARRAAVDARNAFPGFRLVARPYARPDGRVVIAFTVGTGTKRVAVLQCIERLPGRGGDLILTYSSSDGRWPVRVPGPVAGTA